MNQEKIEMLPVGLRLGRMCLHLMAVSCLVLVVVPARAGVVINEIMFHPASEDSREEFVELFNSGESAADLTGWRLEGGVDFVFPAVTLEQGEYLVVASDPAIFESVHGVGIAVVGGWTGKLGNRRDRLKLTNAGGLEIDDLTYADQGDWAVRREGELDFNHRGWKWHSPADGEGMTLERVSPLMPGAAGRNWTFSADPLGTPGVQNAALRTNIAPLILDPAHFPPLPGTGDTVTVTAEILNETPDGLTVELFHRISTSPPAAFESVPMFDDGLHGDGGAADGIYGAEIPPRALHTVVEFYITAVDAEGNTGSYPAPVLMEDGSTEHAANLLYIVENPYPEEEWPMYRIVLTPSEEAELRTLGDSDALMNATFISENGSGTRVRYLTGVRHRGHGSRYVLPFSFRVNFRTDDPWRGVTALNINAQYSFLQHLGSAVTQFAGLHAADSQSVNVRLNQFDFTYVGARPDITYGRYAANEVLNSDYADRHFPGDGGGNVYRGIRDAGPADFAYRGDNPDSYRNSYFKNTNESEDDWSDLIELCRVLSGLSEEPYDDEVRRVINVEDWLRHLAVMAIMDNQESGLNNGRGDDYFMYRGIDDPRFYLLPYDLDSIFGQGGGAGAPDATIWGAAAIPALSRLMKSDAFAPLYFGELDRLIREFFATPRFESLVDQVLGHAPIGLRNSIKSFTAERAAHILTLIPRELTAQWSSVGGAEISLSGFADAIHTRSVTVNGATASWTAWQGRWSLDSLSLVEGTNEIVVRMLDEAGLEIGLAEFSLDYDPNGGGVSTLAAVEYFRSGFTGGSQVESDVSAAQSEPTTVRLSELLVANRSFPAPDGELRDFVELLNEGDVAADLSGLRVTDDLARPDRFEFPDGSMLEAGERLVLHGGNGTLEGMLFLGFALDADGEEVWLLDSAERGGAVLDNVSFGLQLADMSIGRIGGGDWTLNIPTPGQSNIAEATSSTGDVFINEWLLIRERIEAPDFIELYNGSDRPCDIGGMRLSNHPDLQPDRVVVPDLSFIAGRGHRVFWASGCEDCGGDELPFSLKDGPGVLGLFAEDGVEQDRVYLRAQTNDRSEGRTPSGGSRIGFFDEPTPGQGNPIPAFEERSVTTVVAESNGAWRFNQAGVDLGTQWRMPDYDDSVEGWEDGQATFYNSNMAAGGIRNTELIYTDPQQATFYFRREFDYSLSDHPATLDVDHLTDDGLVVYLNGLEVFRWNLRPGTVTYSSNAPYAVVNPVRYGPISLVTGALRDGRNVLAVEVHQSLPSADAVFDLEATVTEWVIEPVNPLVEISEVMAAGPGSDWVELFNPGEAAVDLAGMRLADGGGNEWMFPPESVIGGGARRQVFFDGALDPSNTNTGFGLDRDGDLVLLFDRLEAGGALLDRVDFGFQAVGYSVGRVAGLVGDWMLNAPTPGSENQVAPTGSPNALRINEWMAQPIEGADWIELFNTGVVPVALGGLFISDDSANPNRHVFRALSFVGVGPDAYRLLWADDRTDDGPTHLGFKLSTDGENIILLDPAVGTVDSVVFGAQRSGVSEGRYPDGAASFHGFEFSVSPGAPNHLDSDGDGMPDEWESEHGFDPDNADDAGLDFDLDGQSNLLEYLGGSDPRRGGERFAISIGIDPSRGLVLTLGSRPVVEFAVQTKRSIVEGEWENLFVVDPDSEPSIEFVVGEISQMAPAFYRVIVLR